MSLLYADKYFLSKISIRKERGLYQNKVNLSLKIIRRLAHQGAQL